MLQHELASVEDGYLLTYEELLRLPTLKLVSSGRDYIFFALQIDYPGTLNPAIDVATFCAPEGISYAARRQLNNGDLYKALGDLRKKGIVVSISSQLNLQLS